jgi:hypothetical protein
MRGRSRELVRMVTSLVTEVSRCWLGVRSELVHRVTGQRGVSCD